MVEWCEQRDFVRAAIVTSTRAVENAAVDDFSDLDVILVLSDIAPLSDGRHWLSDFGDVLAAWRDVEALTRVPPRTCWVTQYADGSKIDFSLWPVELMREVASGSALPDQLDVGDRVVVDKDGLTATLHPAVHHAHIPPPPSREEFLILVEDFYLESTYVAKHLRRGDLMPAKFSLDQVMKQENLRRMLEWSVEIGRGWSWKPGAAGKGFQKVLAPDTYRSLETTYVGADVEENWTALLNTIALFRKVAVHVAEHFGYPYPHDMHDRVIAYLQRARAFGR